MAPKISAIATPKRWVVDLAEEEPMDDFGSEVEEVGGHQERQTKKETEIFYIDFSPPAGRGNLKLKFTTLSRIFIHVVCQFNSTAFATRKRRQPRK